MNTKTSAILLGALAALALALPSGAQTVFVCKDQDFCGLLADAPFESLGEAIAALNDGGGFDTIRVFEAEYEPELIDAIEQPVTIQGIGFAPDIKIQGNGVSPVLQIMASGVTIEGITLTGGSAGISVSGEDAVIYRCYIDGNETGIEITSGAEGTTIVSSSIVNSTDYGVEINSDGTVADEILSTTITDNTNSGIFFSSADAELEIHNSIVWGNGTDVDAAAIMLPSQIDGTFNNIRMTVNFPATDLGDPFFDPDGEWRGKLLAEDPGNPGVVNPMIDAGNDSVSDPDFDLDLESEPRSVAFPTGAGVSDLDIGADEVTDGVALNGIWTYTEIEPKLIGRVSGGGEVFAFLEFIGGPAPTLTTGDVVALVPESLSDQFASGPLPQSVFSTEAARDRLVLFETVVSAGNLLFVVNQDLVETFGADGAPVLANLMDGRATLHLYLGGSDSVAYGGTDDADRQAVIDTTPPNLRVPVSGAGLVPTSNDSVTAGSVAAVYAPNIPGSFPANWPGVDPIAYSDGAITGVSGGPGAKVFFNARPDVAGGTNFLNFTVRAIIEDLPPIVDGVRPDIEVAGLTEIQPGEFAQGFDVLPLLEEGVDSNGSSPLWFFQNGRNVFDDSALEVTVSATDLSLTGGSAIETTWEFVNIQFQDGFQVSTRLGGRDAAGNVTDTEDLLDPLGIWWMREVDVSISGPNNAEVAAPEFQWNLIRASAPGPSLPAEPIFRYRLWAALNPDNATGPYAPVNDSFLTNQGLGVVETLTDDGPGLYGWSTEWVRDQGLAYNWFTLPGGLLDAGYANRWLVIQVIGADEAGNVSLNETPIFASPAGQNWRKFKISSDALIGTRLSATFWHDNIFGNTVDELGRQNPGENYFGSTRLVPLPNEEDFSVQGVREQVAGEFTVISNSPVGSSVRVIVQVFRAGDTTPLGGRNYLIAGSSPGRITTKVAISGDLPADTPPSFRGIGDVEFGDLQRRRAETYLVRAITEVDGQADPNPAEFVFTVVPNVAEYIENPFDPDDQPVKVIESN